MKELTRLETNRKHRGTTVLFNKATTQLGPEESAELIKEEVKVVYKELFEDSFERHTEEQYIVDQADAEKLITLSEPG